MAGFASKLKIYLRKPWLIVTLVIVAGGIVLIYRGTRPTAPAYATVSRGEVTQTVSVTGQVEAAKEVSLAFEKSGKITRVYADVGQKVSSGDVLVSLAADDLRAQLASAGADVDSAQAKLDELQKGARPEEIAIKQAALDQANLSLSSAYSGLFNTLESAYINADDAIRKQCDPFFNNDETNPSLAFQTVNFQAQVTAETGRTSMTGELGAWKNSLAGLGPLNSQASLDQGLADAERHLLNVQNFLKILGDTLVQQTGLSASSLTSFQTALTTARTEIASSLTNVTAAKQTLAADKLAVNQAEANLGLTKAGSTPEAIRAQEAVLEGARASVLNIQAQIAKTVLRAPIAGVVTDQEAKPGEIAPAQTPIVKMMSASGFQITSQVPETDIGLVAVGKPVSMTLDALPGTKFDGHVLKIDPAETVVEGIATYKTTVGIDSSDPRIKSGMTANMDILVDSHPDALYLPQRAVSSSGGKRYVTYINADGKQEEREIRTGLRGQEGQIEIISGLQEGDRVLRLGQ